MTREVIQMAKPGGANKKSSVDKRGGYEPGPKKVSDLTPPPKTPGAGAKPSNGSGGSGSTSKT